MEPAVFRRASSGGGERLSLGVLEVDALENHPNGVDFCLFAVLTGGCGDGARASDLRRAVGPLPHGTDGSEAEKFPNLEGLDTGFGGATGADSSFTSYEAVTLLTDRFGGSPVVDAWEGARSSGGRDSTADDVRLTGSVSGREASVLLSTSPSGFCPVTDAWLWRWEGCSEPGSLSDGSRESGLESSLESLASSKVCTS